jgi:hypothetical protein
MPWRRAGKWRYISIFPDLGTRWGEWSASHPGHFTPGEGVFHCIGGWVDPAAGLEAVGKKKFITPAGNWFPVVKHVARLCTDWAASYDTTVISGYSRIAENITQYSILLFYKDTELSWQYWDDRH